MPQEITSIFSHTTGEGATGDLGIDKDGNLYWNQKKVVTQQRLTLGRWVNISIVAGGLSTIVIALVSIWEAFVK